MLERVPEFSDENPELAKVIFLCPVTELEGIKLLAVIRQTSVTQELRKAMAWAGFRARLIEQGLALQAAGPEGEVYEVYSDDMDPSISDRDITPEQLPHEQLRIF